MQKNYEEAITTEKELHVIEFIVDYEPIKDSKDTVKRYLAFVRKAKEKGNIDFEILTRTIKNLSNELEELKQSSSETTVLVLF